MLKNLKVEKNGITLVALVVTIIILLILVGVSISLANSSILDKAVFAVSENNEASAEEYIELSISEAKMELISDNNEKSYSQLVKENLEKNKDFRNVTVSESENSTLNISFTNKNEKYKYVISSTGNVKSYKNNSENIKIGDYIEYPIEYKDVYSSETFNSKNGWRILDDGKNSGTIKIISTGIPLKYQFLEDVVTEVNNLKNNFSNFKFIDSNWKKIYGSSYLINDLGQSITTLTLEELNYTYNNLNNDTRVLNDTSALSNLDTLFYISPITSNYWLATASESEAYYVANENIFLASDMRAGIRPVIVLRDNLIYEMENNVWKIY